MTLTVDIEKLWNARYDNTGAPFPVDGTAAGDGSSLSLPGATAATRYAGATSSGAPASGSFLLGDFVVDQTGSVWVCTTAGSPGTWTQVAGTTPAVTSVAGRTGAVVIGESDVTNLSSDLAALAPLASPMLTGTPVAPTPTSSDNSTKLATTAFVTTAIAGIPPSGGAAGYPGDVTQAPYNAVGDGVTDDTTAIQSALNVGGALYFPKGKTFLCGKLTVSVAGTVLRGANGGFISTPTADCSIIKLKNGINDDLIYIPAGVVDVHIIDMQLDGNKSGQASGTGAVIHLANTGAYEQTQFKLIRSFVKSGYGFGISIGNERGGTKIAHSTIYSNSNSTDQNEGIRCEGADLMVHFCSVGANGGPGIGVGIGPAQIISNGIWGNNRGVEVYSTVSEVALIGNAVDTNNRQGFLIYPSTDAITVIGNIFHSNSWTVSGQAQMYFRSTLDTATVIGNTSGPLDSGYVNVPTYLVQLDTSVKVAGFGNTISAGSVGALTNDVSRLSNPIQAGSGLDAAKPAVTAVPTGSWYLSNDINGGTLYVSDGATMTAAAPGKTHGNTHLPGGGDAITWGSLNLDAIGVPTGNINFNGKNAGSIGAVVMTGLTGATSGTRFVGATASGAPASGSFLKGDFIVDQTGSFWICTVAGTSGTWVQIAPGGAGGFSSIIPTNIVAPFDPRLMKDAATMAVSNGARGCRVRCPVAGTLTDLAVYVSVASGNMDVGVFNAGGASMLTHSGAVAMSGLTASAWNIIISGSLSITVTAGEELDFMVSADNTTAAFGGYSMEAATSGALPANFWDSTGAVNIVWNAASAYPLSAGLTYSTASSAKCPLIIARIV